MEDFRECDIIRYFGKSPGKQTTDTVAIEAPLQILLRYMEGGQEVTRALAVTMRTPGNDTALIRGFLYAEGIVNKSSDIRSISPAPARHADAVGHAYIVHLNPEIAVHWPDMERHLYTSSSCGVCGRTSIESVMQREVKASHPMKPQITPEVVLRLPLLLRNSQPLFARTGGNHGCALADASGNILNVQEDVGRHNAADKLIGTWLEDDAIRREAVIGILSGRASFELVQKFLMAEIPILVSVGAPSSLALDLAIEGGMTLIGFASNDRFNVYSGSQRIL